MSSFVIGEIFALLASLIVSVSYLQRWRKWSTRKSVYAYILIALTVIVVFHPGARKPYAYYIVGLIAKYGEYTAPHRPVNWARIEGPQYVTTEKPPNVVLILADDLGYNDLSGGAGVPTPNIDSIRQRGVTFTQAYSGHATCSPARAALLTGRYPSRFGYEYTAVHWMFAWALTRPDSTAARQPVFHSELLKDVPKEAEMICPTSEVMISNVLKERNYSTVYIGKWHLGETKPALPNNRGYDETLVFLRGASKYLPTEHPDVVNAYLGDAMDDFLFDNLGGNVRHNGTARFPPKEYITDYFGKQAANAIRTKMMPSESADNATTPLFLTVAYNAPHTPLQASRADYQSEQVAHIESHRDKVYAAMILALDRSVGYILDAIKETQQEDNTIVIFTSDNGGPGYVGIPSMNKPLRGWKATFFEGGFRVPMFISWPKIFSAGTIYDRPVSHVDIFATVATAAGVDYEALKSKQVYDGVDLRPFVTDTRGYYIGKKDPHAELFWRTGDYKAFRMGDWKIQVSDIPDRVWMTNLDVDASEVMNLAKGLSWSLLSRILNSTESEIDCISELTKNKAALDEALLSRVCHLGRSMVAMDVKQAAPLWPGLAVVPVPVDSASLTVKSVDEEYVYWTN